MYAGLLYGQRRAIVAASEAVNIASVQAEYVVGVLIAIVAARYLVPSALSLMGGLAEALLNNKAMFPASQSSAWVLILTTCEVVPIYAALLAMFQQLVGDAILAIVCVLAALFISMGIFTGHRILSVKAGDTGREHLYKRIWFEYFLRVFCGVGIMCALIAWVTLEHNGLKEYLRIDLLTPEVMALAIVDMLSKKVVTAVGGTDAVLSAFVQTEVWFGALPRDEQQAHDLEVQEVDTLMQSQGDDFRVATPDPSGPQVVTVLPQKETSCPCTIAHTVCELEVNPNLSAEP